MVIELLISITILFITKKRYIVYRSNMARKKDIKIILDTYGNYLGMEKGCIILRDKKRNETRYPLIENTVGEIVLNSGNMVSTGLLTYLGYWGIDVLVSTRYGRPIAMLKDLEDDCHVETRVSQYIGR